MLQYSQAIKTQMAMKRKQQDGYLDDARLKKEILKHIKEDRYRLTKHGAEELKNDDLDLNDLLYVLATGNHNFEKTGFNSEKQIWKYAIEGATKDQKKIRVIIAFVDEMLIITVMEL